MDGYSLSRQWFDWSFENPEKVSPNHSALYFFAIEHCNRLGWRKKFGFPTEMAKDAIGIKSYHTYINTFNDLVEWGFIEVIERSKNQYSANIIALANFDKANDNALNKAIGKHLSKQQQSSGQSKSTIIKQIPTIEPENQETREQDTTIVVGEQALEVIEDKKIEKKEYGDTDINKTLSYMSKAVGCTTFKESQAQQRIYGKHLFNLGKEIGLEEFNFRLETILSDQFKAKNCNKLAYLYGELKSFIHSPVIKTKEKESVMDIVL